MASNRRKHLLASQLSGFVQQYSRKSQKGVEPNVRGHSREIEEIVKQPPPEELSELLVGETIELVTPPKKKKPMNADPFENEVKRMR